MHNMIKQEDILIQQLREINYPGPIDVTDAVMRQVGNKPFLVPQRHLRWGRISVGVAACAMLFVSINITRLFTHEYDLAKISSALTEVYDYHADYGYGNESYYSLGSIEALNE